MDAWKMLIGGEFTDAASGKTSTVADPSTEDSFATVPLGGREDARRAIEAARKAFDSGPWPRMAQKERIKRLLALVDGMKKRESELAAVESRQGGIPIRTTTLMDIPVGMDIFRAMVEASDFPRYEPLPWTDFPSVSWNFINREPIGVCAGIVPWNFPFFFLMWKAPAALSMGNTFVFKPASQTPLTALIFAEICAEADIPPGVFNVVTGPGATVGAELCESPLVDKVSFTGSTATGREVQKMTSGNIKRLTLELGGKSPIVVLDDAWLDITADMVLWACYWRSGQACEAGTRLLLQEGIYDRFMERLLEKIKVIKVGPADDFSTTVGPLISARQRERVEYFIESGKEQGARLLRGGGRTKRLDKGYFLEPTLFDNVGRDMKIFQEEIFGPVLSVTKFKTESEAVELANDSIYGLAGSVHTSDVPKGIEIAKKIRAGRVWVNDHHMFNGEWPFGGYKQSGVGKDIGVYAMKEYTEEKHIYVDQIGDRRDKKFWIDYIISE
ncbi:MAG: aldehyde dehydrogenase family protein [Nitrospinota bacterium]